MQWIDPFTQQVLSHNQYTELFPKQDTYTPVGISEKGWVIACGGDWYLYLSLYTQPNIEWKHQN